MIYQQNILIFQLHSLLDPAIGCRTGQKSLDFIERGYCHNNVPLMFESVARRAICEIPPGNL
jgi:hypothetical protein